LHAGNSPTKKSGSKKATETKATETKPKIPREKKGDELALLRAFLLDLS
jgi:hypothetical protein